MADDIQEPNKKTIKFRFLFISRFIPQPTIPPNQTKPNPASNVWFSNFLGLQMTLIDNQLSTATSTRKSLEETKMINAYINYLFRFCIILSGHHKLCIIMNYWYNFVNLYMYDLFWSWFVLCIYKKTLSCFFLYFIFFKWTQNIFRTISD